MLFSTPKTTIINRRVRAILLTGHGTILFIKRVKPLNPQPYWVAPGGVEMFDKTLIDALHRELCEELGAQAEILDYGFVLKHEKAGKNLEEHFFVCKLLTFDLSLRHGPEFVDPKHGLYIPEEIPLTEDAICNISIKTQELEDWLLDNLQLLYDYS